MPRGRQYYDPIVQHPAIVAGEKDLSRIELYPEGAPEDPTPKWRARRITADGGIAETTFGDFDHDRALEQAQAHWANLPVYELRSEGEDSTWEGHGPSPRLWQQAGALPTEIPPAVPPGFRGVSVAPLNIEPVDGPQQPGGPAAPQPTEEQAALHLLVAPQPGAYMLLADVLRLLEMWAVSYEMDKNPSGALALREAVDALKDIG